MLRLPEVERLVAALDAAARVGPVWSDYTLANHAVVLLDQRADTLRPACAAIWRAAAPPTTRGLRRRVDLATPLYGMWNGDPVGPRPLPNGPLITKTLSTLPPELEADLRAGGIARAIMLQVPVRFEDIGSLGKALAGMRIDPVSMLTQLAVHESYHLHSQIAVWLDQPHMYSWPSWDVQPDRKKVVDLCYNGSPAIAQTLDAELTALLAAWDLARDTVPHSEAGVSRAARRFIELRRRRYMLLDGSTVPSPVGPLPCSTAEDLLELEEGAPQWMAYETAVRAGVMKAEAAGRSSSEKFYVSGTFQLWILNRLLGDTAMRRLTSEITRAPSMTDSKGAIFRVFARHFGA